METIVCVILLVFNVIVYVSSFYFILKRKEFSCISIRSPILLLANNFGGFLLTTIIISFFLNDAANGNKHFYYIPFGFYLSEILMVSSFILRCQRIVACCKIEDNEQYDKDEFSKKRHLYGEKYYVKVLGIIFILFTVALVIILVVKKYYSTIPNMLYSELEGSPDFRLSLFLIVHFLILFSLITYSYKVIISDVKQKILFEVVAFTVCWFVFVNVIAALDYFNNKLGVEKYKNLSIAISLIILYCCLFLNGFLPVILSYCYQTSIVYHFNPQLMNNLYLFLSNEECYGNFSEFLKNDEEYSFYLRVYTHIMKFKLEFLNEESIAHCCEEAKDILQEYFTGPYLSRFDNSTIEKINTIKNEGIKEDNTVCEMYDSALKFVFEKLSDKFLEFKNTVQFEILKKSLATQSYIQCKMSNTGLINKF